MKVTDKFPLDERPQYGVVVKNSSGESLPLAADNFMAIVESHCFMAKLKGKKGKFLEWVKEDEQDITNRVTEDLSSQVAPGNATFTISAIPCEGKGNVNPTRTPRHVEVSVNGERRAKVILVNGTQIILEEAPPSGAEVFITYWKRVLIQAGVYYVELSEVDLYGGGQVMVDPLYDVKMTILQNAVGNETSFQLTQFPVFQGTFELVEIIPNPPVHHPEYPKEPHPCPPRPQEVVLTQGVHYNLDYMTGLITFLPSPENPAQTLRYGATYRVYYRVQGATMGPFPVHRLESRNHILPGVVLAFGQWFEQGDKLVVIVTDERHPVSREYGGDFDMNITMDIYSRDPIQRELLADLVAMHFWAVLKPRYDAIGLLLKSVSLNGESEDMYDENTDTVYYMAGIDLSITADWRLYIPIVVWIKKLCLDLDMVLNATDFKVTFKPQERMETLL